MIPKFRAWSTFKNEWAKHFYITESGLIYNMEQPHRDLIGAVPVEKSGLILMQSTGLFDKNGVEIFEGDVVETESFKDYEDFSGYRKRGEVVFREGYFGIRYPKDSKRYPYHMLVAAIDIENIGNIYENPELLESVEE
ncbi:YopX family protein [Streptococcus dysgalactiae subsp. equisimilis]|uniref:YopX family protein n=1 Tax=Streptococcus dysgalactiae TaxID=1334 RepID=UPI001F12E7D2|nr:YopX family protein [Streptococcus dysgalactiae]UMY67882.1 YopX family protein [Streptococcus dysgalactiae subsp. equisimilis]